MANRIYCFSSEVCVFIHRNETVSTLNSGYFNYLDKQERNEHMFSYDTYTICDVVLNRDTIPDWLGEQKNDNLVLVSESIIMKFPLE